MSIFVGRFKWSSSLPLGSLEVSEKASRGRGKLMLDYWLIAKQLLDPQTLLGSSLSHKNKCITLSRSLNLLSFFEFFVDKKPIFYNEDLRILIDLFFSEKEDLLNIKEKKNHKNGEQDLLKQWILVFFIEKENIIRKLEERIQK